MIYEKKDYKFLGFKPYSNKKTWLPQIVLNLCDNNWFSKALFLDSSNELVRELENLTFWDIIVLQGSLNLK